VSSSGRSGTGRRAGGRPRHDESDRGRAITTAVLEAVFEQGLPGVTMEGIARRAGVAKTTIYRRWPNREAMIIEALGTIYTQFEAPDTGDVRADLKELVREAARSGLLSLRGTEGVARLIISAAADRRYWRIAMEPWGRLVRQVLERGRERGQVRREVDTGLAADLVTGAVVFRALDQAGPLGRAFLEGVVDAVLDGIVCP
jgi:AcrR family transcriptional regulator